MSDGPVTQYRNKTMFYLLACHLGHFYPDITAFTWNYHEAGHGKGAPDGVGAVCKRTADKFVSLGTDVSCLDSLAKIIRDNCPEIRISLVTDKDIEEVQTVIDGHIEHIVPFTGTMRVHQVCGNALLPNKVLFRELSCFCNGDFLCIHLKLGDITYNVSAFKAKVADIFSSDDSQESGKVAGFSGGTLYPSPPQAL